MQCHSELQNDAEIIMGLGGYPKKTVDEAYATLRAEIPCRGPLCSSTKIDFARDILNKPPLPEIETLVKDCTVLPPGLDTMPSLQRIAALDPSCENQARMIFENCKDPGECKGAFRRLSLEFHPDLGCVNDGKEDCRKAFDTMIRAHELLQDTLPSVQTLDSSDATLCENLPENLASTDPEERIMAFRKGCKNQAEMILENCKNEASCRETYNQLAADSEWDPGIVGQLDHAFQLLYPQPEI